MIQPITASLLALTLLFAPVTTPAGAVVDSRIPEAEDSMEAIKTEIDSVAKQEGLDPTQVRVTLTWFDAANFQASIYVSVDGSDPTDSPPVMCPAKDTDFCLPEKFPIYIATALREAAAKRPKHDPEPEEPIEPPDPGGKETDGDDGDKGEKDKDGIKVEDTPIVSQKTDAPVDKKLHGLGYAGIASLSLGIAAGATGGVFLGLGETRPDETDQSLRRDFQPSGYALIGVGGALITTGAVLLAVDLTRDRRQKQRAFIRPTLGGIAGRF